MPPKKPPVVFIGHGSPMNAVEDNPFTRALRSVGEVLEPRPESILMVSAHWMTRGTFVSAAEKPEMIYDMVGFPDELYRIRYEAPGSPEIAAAAASLDPRISTDRQRGLDHGAWSVLVHLYPGADIPVFQLSVDMSASMAAHVEVAQSLRSLRDEGVMIVGSGNIVHNLRLAFTTPPDGEYRWARRFDDYVKTALLTGDISALVDYRRAGEPAALSVPTTDHYIPLLYTVGAMDDGERPIVFYEEIQSSLSMMSFFSEPG